MTEDDRGTSDRKPPGAVDSSSGGSWSRRIRAGLRYLGRTALALASLGVLIFVLLHFGVAMGWIVPKALARVVPEGWTVRVDGVEGSWLNRIAVSGLSLEGPDLTLSADRLVLGYRLRPLLDQRISLRTLVVDGPVLELTMADSGAMEDAGAADSTSVGAGVAMLAGEPVSGWAVRADSVEVQEGVVRLRMGDGGRYDVSRLRLSGKGGLGPDGLEATVDTLGASFRSAMSLSSDSTFRSEGVLALVGSLRDGTLRLDTLVLSSNHSDVLGGGDAVFVPEPRILGAVQMRIHARPLDLRDLPLRLDPGLLAHPRFTVALDAGGRPDSLLVELDVEREATGTTAEARMTVRPGSREGGITAGEEGGAGGDVGDGEGARGPLPALAGRLRFEELELTPWSPSPFDGWASGDLDVRLETWGGAAPFTLRGTVRHRPGTVDPSRLLTRPMEASLDVDGRLP
ncbi:MAG: hypothetical protein R3304_13290, partial [Longimicrobiales bacterium]|nr:hypothetical protein [Longimicrobiales bacterium]